MLGEISNCADGQAQHSPHRHQWKFVDTCVFNTTPIMQITVLAISGNSQLFSVFKKIYKISAHADGGPHSWVCAHYPSARLPIDMSRNVPAHMFEDSP
jgi:hypothetical protein